MSSATTEADIVARLYGDAYDIEIDEEGEIDDIEWQAQFWPPHFRRLLPMPQDCISPRDVATAWCGAIFGWSLAARMSHRKAFPTLHDEVLRVEVVRRLLDTCGVDGDRVRATIRRVAQ